MPHSRITPSSLACCREVLARVQIRHTIGRRHQLKLFIGRSRSAVRRRYMSTQNLPRPSGRVTILKSLFSALLNEPTVVCMCTSLSCLRGFAYQLHHVAIQVKRYCSAAKTSVTARQTEKTTKIACSHKVLLVAESTE